MGSCQIVYIRPVTKALPAPNRIKEIREALGMTQVELARRANVTPSALNKVELGTRGLDQDWMRRLAPLLGVAPAELLPDRDNPHRLTTEEREIVERYRAAQREEQQTFRKVADAMLPDRAQRLDNAA
ncbi:transcriptional regulator with XRE-family HTH domain [Sphingomonas zeicaulis]|uniref:helix-turn-helix domain-containing protein n=1 Tax=Sphingomonas zeicaulis TaxID=1632740 RepID=UPI003D1C129A